MLPDLILGHYWGKGFKGKNFFHFRVNYLLPENLGEMSLSQSKVKKSLPINKVTRSCVEGEMSDMVFLEPHLTDEVVPENFMDPPIERKPFQREMVHSRTIIYLQPLRKIPERFSVHLERLPKGTTCFSMEKLPKKSLEN